MLLTSPSAVNTTSTHRRKRSGLVEVGTSILQTWILFQALPVWQVLVGFLSSFFLPSVNSLCYLILCLLCCQSTHCLWSTTPTSGLDTDQGKL